MSAVAEQTDAYRASFESFAASAARAEAPWLRSLRASAMARFMEKGFPTTRDEAWRYTSVAPIARTSFKRPEGAAVAGAAAAELEELRAYSGQGAVQAVFVNGRYAPELSSGRMPAGVELLSLREALARIPQRLELHLAHQAGEGNAFAQLNTAFLEDGAFVAVAPGQAVAEPIHLLYLSTNPAAGASLSHPRSLIVAGAGSQASIVESYGGPDGESYFTNAVTEAVVEDAASLDHYTLQREGGAAFHVATLQARVGRAGRFSSHSISLGGSLVRNDVSVVLDGEGSECALLGLFMAAGTQHMDSHTVIDHARPHTTSQELYKGIVDGRARGVFNGRIVVRKGAQKTDAYQSNKNVLLSNDALVNSTPALEIFADDVKCKHGSTTGQLDPAALFYLRARGLDEASARRLLTYAFASDLVQRIRVEPLRARLTRRLQSDLPSLDGIGAAVA